MSDPEKVQHAGRVKRWLPGPHTSSSHFATAATNGRNGVFHCNTTEFVHSNAETIQYGQQSYHQCKSKTSTHPKKMIAPAQFSQYSSYNTSVEYMMKRRFMS